MLYGRVKRGVAASGNETRQVTIESIKIQDAEASGVRTRTNGESASDNARDKCVTSTQLRGEGPQALNSSLTLSTDTSRRAAVLPAPHLHPNSILMIVHIRSLPCHVSGYVNPTHQLAIESSVPYQRRVCPRVLSASCLNTLLKAFWVRIHPCCGFSSPASYTAGKALPRPVLVRFPSPTFTRGGSRSPSVPATSKTRGAW